MHPSSFEMALKSVFWGDGVKSQGRGHTPCNTKRLLPLSSIWNVLYENGSCGFYFIT